jgi:hypothetical protein
LPRRWRPVQTWRASQATRLFTMTFLNRAPLSNRLWCPAHLALRRRSSRALLTRMRLTCGRWDSEARLSLLPAQIRVNAGHITRSSRTTVGGTESTPITTLTGTIQFMTVWAILAATIRNSLAMISSTAPTQLAQRLAMTAALIRLEWRPGQNGSVAVTWTRATAHRRGTSSAWNSSLRLIHSTALLTKGTLPRRPTLPSTPGVARPVKGAPRGTNCESRLSPKKLLVSKWW